MIKSHSCTLQLEAFLCGKNAQIAMDTALMYCGQFILSRISESSNSMLLTYVSCTSIQIPSSILQINLTV